MNTEIENRLIDCVRQFYTENKEAIENENVIITRPYIPYIPDEWSNILLLAEAQNLSTKYQSYVDKLNNQTEEQLFKRLDDPRNLGILPWDDNSLKIAVEAGMHTDYRKVGVSNACFWSIRDDGGANANPTANMQTLSTNLWNRIFKIISPRVVITVGDVAHNIINASTYKGKHGNLCHPSSSYLSKFSNLVDESLILEKFPEIKTLDEMHPKWMVRGHYRQNKLFYAMHTISRLRNLEIEQ